MAQFGECFAEFLPILVQDAVPEPVHEVRDPSKARRVRRHRRLLLLGKFMRKVGSHSAFSIGGSVLSQTGAMLQPRPKLFCEVLQIDDLILRDTSFSVQGTVFKSDVNGVLPFLFASEDHSISCSDNRHSAMVPYQPNVAPGRDDKAAVRLLNVSHCHPIEVVVIF
jgi:hypothetical protein